MTYGIYPFTKAIQRGAKRHTLMKVTTSRNYFVQGGRVFSNGWNHMIMA